MSVCGACSNSIDDGKEISCAGVCNGVFHASCANDGVTTRSLKNWKCVDCRQKSVSNKSSSSSTALTKEFLVRVLEDFKTEVFSELKGIKTEMTELASSTQFLSDKVDESNNLMSEMRKELADIRKENEELRAQNTQLSNQVGKLQERMRNLEQYTRKNNIEVSGVPVTPQEDVKAIVRDLGAALGVEVQPNQIAAAHRIPAFNKTRIPSMVVQFQDRDVKDQLLTKFREARRRSAHLTADKVNKAYPPNRVYVNDHLSPENKQFLADLKKKCQEVGYTFVWCHDGKFFVRKSEGDKVKRVSTMDDIVNLK